MGGAITRMVGRPAAAGGGSWQTVRTSHNGNYDSTGWNGWTNRQVIAASSLTDLSASLIRISVKAGSTQLKIAKMYVGLKAATWDYTTTPTQVLFGGIASVTVSSGAVQVSDSVSFAYDGTSDLVIGVYHDATAAYNASQTNSGRGLCYQKNADDAATVSPTGFSTGVTQDTIWLIEAFA